MYNIVLITKGGYSDLNREHIVPHTTTLPLSYIHLKYLYFPFLFIIKTNKKLVNF
jgi:hypothetical protein